MNCKKCDKKYDYDPEQIIWDEHGYGYSTKLQKCPYCGCLNVVEYIEDRAMRMLNRNDWEYEY